MPAIYSSSEATDVYSFFYTGALSYPSTFNGYDIVPVTNLKIGVNIVGGTGTKEDPFLLSGN